MATNNAPKHDFAPAWLKIPNQENSKPPGTKQGKRFPSGPNSKFRHHSVDDDFYAYTYGPYGYYNGYGYPEKFNVHYTSQPSLLRTPGQRDSKYQHPHARYGTSQGMNVGYPPYYDFLPPYEYYPNDPYYNTNNTYSSRGSTKRSYYEKDGRTNSKEGKDKEEKKEKEGEKEKPFNDDFPSLNGGVEKSTSEGSKQVNGTGVWDNPPINKTGKSGEDNCETSQQASKVLRDANIYKNLVPNKSTIPRRPVQSRVNGSYPREQSSFTGLKPPTPTSSSSSPGLSKETPSTPPIDILNTRFVTQPKTLSDKKSSFLKALRQEDSEKNTDKKAKSVEEDLTNGFDDLSVSTENSNLSSSLEAEQRLLREMGWNEADDEEYEITEDDMKEFQNLSKQVQQQRNGVIKPIPKTWSPKHIPAYQPNVNDLNETLSSSDTDSDEAEN